MSGKPVPIDLVPYMEMIGDSREFLRVWAKEGDPAGFGVALVDCIRHGAKTWARATGISEAEALARIWEGVDAERARPTDIITELPTPETDGLIH